MLHGGEDFIFACSFREVVERQEAGVVGVHAGAVGLSYDNGSGGGADIFTWVVCTKVVVDASVIGYGTESFCGDDREVGGKLSYFSNMIICSSRVTSRILVGGETALGVRRLCYFFVIGCWAGTEVTRMKATISVRPAVMDRADSHFDCSATPRLSVFAGLGQL